MYSKIKSRATALRIALWFWKCCCPHGQGPRYGAMVLSAGEGGDPVDSCLNSFHTHSAQAFFGCQLVFTMVRATVVGFFSSS